MFHLECFNSRHREIVNENNESLIADIRKRVRYFIENLGLYPVWENITIEFISSSEMDSKDQTAAGLCYNLGNGYSRIYVRCGYSYAFTKSILAHEIGHAWINGKNIQLNNVELEGFCQLLAYKMLLSDFSTEGNNQLDALSRWEDEVYGEGFRLMKRRAESLGWEQFILFISLKM